MRLEWDGKPTQVERLSLPFQTVETINESRATRERDAGSLLGGARRDDARRNQLDLGRQQARHEQPAEGVRRPGQARSTSTRRSTPGRTSRSGSRSATPTSTRSRRSSRSMRTATRGAAGASRTSSMLYERLVLIHELLADDGSLYLHCGPNVSHYSKLVCDEIFGPRRFRNEIIWKRSRRHSDTDKARASRADSRRDPVLRKGGRVTFERRSTRRYDEEYIDAQVSATSRRRRAAIPPRRHRRPGGAAKGEPALRVPRRRPRYWRYQRGADGGARRRGT